MIPLEGQGKPLPSDCPYEGEWLVENVIFLYRPLEQHSSAPRAKRRRTRKFQLSDGQWCFGFDSMLLAQALGVGNEQIFNANRNGTLTLVSVRRHHGATHAMSYAFRLGDRRTEVTIKGGAPSYF
jgi:hypothetical protein